MPTPNAGIPYVPEGTQDPAAGLNLALNVIDALLQVRVLTLGSNAPPGSPADGDRHIVGPVGTGAWAGHNNELARYVAESISWQFYAPDTIALAVNEANGGGYAWSGAAWLLQMPSLAALTNAVDDVAAAAAGVPVGALYRNGSVLMIRVA